MFYIAQFQNCDIIMAQNSDITQLFQSYTQSEDFLKVKFRILRGKIYRHLQLHNSSNMGQLVLFQLTPKKSAAISFFKTLLLTRELPGVALVNFSNGSIFTGKGNTH